ncbi:PepSY domain-containing protein [Enterococcus sp. 669A]|uniref:PepSY domain-containing protein n=1 Tax=Candidatus Enterococcus moelleringii TaxID=2815325 RepID=A0ABS3LBC0_9ENTE|nr:PepSY domain-containing protein [Enterococcus sp. 669A]MBO1306922.1 PepSY domain-containing protein [Enterococcus sp. 669A]
MKKTMMTLLALGGMGVLLAGCGPNNQNLESNTNTNTTSSSSANSQATSGTSTANSSNTATNTTGADAFAISLADAISIYQEQYPDSDITGIDINDRLGNFYYEVTGVDDNTEYEIDIDANNGEFKLDREEALDNDERDGVERRQESLNLDNLLSLDEINQIALSEVPNGTINEWSLEKELSTTYWEVSVRDGSREVNVSIDAQSGNVLETEVDD